LYRRQASDTTAFALGPDGRAAATVPAEKARKPYAVVGSVFELSPKYKTMWYLLTREGRRAAGRN